LGLIVDYLACHLAESRPTMRGAEAGLIHCNGVVAIRPSVPCGANSPLCDVSLVWDGLRHSDVFDLSTSLLLIIIIKVVTFPQGGSIICFQTLVEHQQENMPRRQSPLQSEMVQGTLDMLILQTLVLGPAHGQTIAHAIERGSDEVLQVEHGSLYPALHRLQNRGWVASFWGTSDNNRRAKYYRLTPEGKRQLSSQTSRWEQLVRAIGRILNPVPEKQP
jgi:PadR family transcriptional regulator, regulatory protein PadR